MLIDSSIELSSSLSVLSNALWSVSEGRPDAELPCHLRTRACCRRSILPSRCPFPGLFNPWPTIASDANRRRDAQKCTRCLFLSACSRRELGSKNPVNPMLLSGEPCNFAACCSSQADKCQFADPRGMHDRHIAKKSPPRRWIASFEDLTHLILLRF